MARPMNRKRYRSDEALQDDRPAKARKRDDSLRDEHSTKRPRRDQAARDNSHHFWQYPPEFWDRLSTIPLIRSALGELDRRTCARPSFPPPPTGLAQDLAPTTTRELARFARHGGPDLRDIRGYPPPTISHQPAGAMSSSSRSRATKSTDPTTLPTSGTTTTKTKKSTTPYNRGFEQHLTDHGVHPIYSSKEPDLEEAMAAIAVPRSSLSPSKFSDSAFRTFRESNARAKDEDDVKAHVVPTIIGARQTHHPSAINTLFRNLEPLTDGTLAPANPDLYYGAYPEELNRSTRNELAGHIIPSTMEDKPMAPNFFLEVKGPDGSLAVATRQARYDGAIGARAIHSLQNYGGEEPQHNGQAHTYSSIYHGGQLQLFAHHVTAPTTPGGRPEYHMSQLRTFGMTDTRETFVAGATAFRNARDLAKQHRDTFIQAANSRYQAGIAAAQEELTITTERGVGNDSSSDEYVDCEDYHTPRGVDGIPSISTRQLRQSFVGTDEYATSQDRGPPADYLDQRDDQRDHSQTSESLDAAIEHAASFATSFTSSLNSGKASSKRPRSSHSPPSASLRSKKHGKRLSHKGTSTGHRE